MAAKLVPQHASCSWEFKFAKPAIEELAEEKRLAFIGKLIKVFNLQLDDIDFNIQKASHEYIRFTRLFEGSLVDFSIGMESAKISINEYTNPNVLKKSYFDLASMINGRELNSVSLAIHRHCSLDGDIRALFDRLCSYDPPSFSEKIMGRGVSYFLEFNEIDLFLIFGVSPSLSVENGIFITFYFQYTNLTMNYDELFGSIQGTQRLALEGVELDIKDKVEL
jgi:hypothetical protein